jgi:hypothetical protein
VICPASLCYFLGVVLVVFVRKMLLISLVLLRTQGDCKQLQRE